MKVAVITSLTASLIAWLATSSCSKQFAGLGTKKKTEHKITVSPPETETKRQVPPGPAPKEDFPEEKKVLPRGIALHVVATDSESWWQNCLYARTPYGDGWTFVSCNKGGGPGAVTLAGLQGACTEIELRVDIYRNIGETCNENASLGLPCKGPYGSHPDWSISPESDAGQHSPAKSSAYAVYDVNNITDPDTLIRSNGGWSLPDFAKLQTSMQDWLKGGDNNRWLRVFFEDQAPSRIREARDYPSDAWTLGVDYNDYVFDIRTENLEIGIKGAKGSTGCPAHGKGAK